MTTERKTANTTPHAVTCLCGQPMRSHRENVKYTASGLSTVVLQNVEVRRCASCGEFELVIPRVEELHTVIASAVIAKPARLTHEEIRYLRKFLGWSGVDFARRIGTTPETVSRWESGKTPMGVQADRLLRLMVAHLRPIENYKEHDIEQAATKVASAARLTLTNKANHWRELMAA